MVEIQKTKIKTSKKILLIVIILFIPLILLILFFMGALAIQPIFGHFEHQKLITLDRESQKIYQLVKAVAPDDEEWKYGTGCGANYSGAWPDGSYTCVAISYMKKPVSSAAEAQSIHDRYFNLLEKRSNLITYREVTNSYIFDKEFVVGGISKEYTETNSDVYCRYDTFVGQADISLNGMLLEEGSKIVDNKGMATIMLKCEQHSNEPWYTDVKSVDGMIPDFTPRI